MHIRFEIGRIGAIGRQLHAAEAVSTPSMVVDDDWNPEASN
jgi:hypothetical protein